MVTDATKEKAELYLTVIDTLWKHAACDCMVEDCSCKKAHGLINKLIKQLEKVVIVEEEE